ncbi:hypothetical protein GQ44DRAFT_425611 [Phaeosphaeriaceae sp. PMI808]|nr:hypothetical protein GQ44DRAFT_425611 [Phaeosphaeriaceae sp. PMI808]
MMCSKHVKIVGLLCRWSCIALSRGQAEKLVLDEVDGEPEIANGRAEPRYLSRAHVCQSESVPSSSPYFPLPRIGS